MSDESNTNNLSSELISIDSDKPKLDKQGVLTQLEGEKLQSQEYG